LTTRDDALAARARRLRNGGQTDRYRHAEFGVNSRLDEIQAAVLRARLVLLPAWTAARRALARRYRDRLSGITRVAVPPETDPGHVYHLFPVLSDSRDALQAHLRAEGVETLIHYPIPVPRQLAFAPDDPQQCPVADRVCDRVLSLPLYPTLDAAAVDRVAAAIVTFDAGKPARTPSPASAS
jgi:dTDP-4-amino-4,6-dideoxygalactose transaminase